MKTTDADRGQCVVRGLIGADGVTARATGGFTSSRGGVGVYYIRFVPPFKTPPEVLTTLLGGAGSAIMPGLPTRELAQINTYGTSAAAFDVGFSFVAIGIPQT